MELSKRMAAEALGTFWLVLVGCGSAVVAGSFGTSGIGLVGVSLAFGLGVLTIVYAIGPISGGHLNPAVSVGLAVAGRFPLHEVPLYAIAQVAGATLGALLVYWLASSSPLFDLSQGLAANGYAELSPGRYGLAAVLVAEMVLTGFFVLIILGSTGPRSHAAVAPLAIGLALTLIHLMSIPISNTSVNPARSTGPALVLGAQALSQLWVFWIAPIAGAVVGAGLYRWLAGERIAQA